MRRSPPSRAAGAGSGVRARARAWQARRTRSPRWPSSSIANFQWNACATGPALDRARTLPRRRLRLPRRRRRRRRRRHSRPPLSHNHNHNHNHHSRRPCLRRSCRGTGARPCARASCARMDDRRRPANRIQPPALQGGDGSGSGSAHSLRSDLSSTELKASRSVSSLRGETRSGTASPRSPWSVSSQQRLRGQESRDTLSRR